MSHDRGKESRPSWAPRSLAFVVCFVGCLPGDPGHYYGLQAIDRDESCGGLSRGPEGRVTYRLMHEEGVVTLWQAGEERPFAEGTLASCTVTYASDEITEARGAGSITWRLTGEATITAGDGCAAEDGWQGTEQVQVLSSSVADIPTGCTVDVDVSGTWLGEVQ